MVGVVCVILEMGGDVMRDDVSRSAAAKVWAQAAKEEAWETWVEAKAQTASSDGNETKAHLRAMAAAKALAAAKTALKATEEALAARAELVALAARASAADDANDGGPSEADLRGEAV